MATRTRKRPRVRRRSDARKNRRRVLPSDRALRARPVDGLVLDGRRLDMQVGDRLLDATLERSLEGPDTVTVSLWNNDRAVLKNGVLGKRVMTQEARIELDELGFIAAGLSKQGDTVEITFEDETVVRLKRHGKGKPRRVSRAKSTRAHFCAGLIRQAGVPVIVLDENVDQPIAKQARAAKGSKKKGSTRADAHPSNPVSSWADKTYPRHYLDTAAGKSRFTARQVYQIALQAGLPARAFEQIAHGESQYYPGVVQRDPGDGMVGYGLWQITPNAWNGDQRLLNKLASLGDIDGMRNPWKCALMARFMYDISGLSPWYGTRYLTAAGRASKPDPRYKHPTAPTGDADVDGGTTTRLKEVAFQRKKGESTWAACWRLLVEEVGWRLFVREGVVVIASEPALMRARPALTIDERTDAVESIDFDWHRALRVGEMSAQAYVGRWKADPGEVIEVKDLPQDSGKWLLASVRASLLSPRPLAELTLRAPQKPKPEPANEVVTTSRGGSGDADISGTVRERIIQIAEASMTSKTGHNYYSLVGATTTDPTPERGLRSDCSQWIRACYLQAGAGDPGTWTGDMATKSRRTSNPKPGDLVLGREHVELYVGGGRTIGHGSPPIDTDDAAGWIAQGFWYATYDFLDR